MTAIMYTAGSTPLWTMTALSGIIGEGVDCSSPGSEKSDGDRWALVTWKSRAGLRPAFVCLEWQGDECAVTVTPSADVCGWDYGNSAVVQRIAGYCAMHRIPCSINEELVFEGSGSGSLVDSLED